MYAARVYIHVYARYTRVTLKNLWTSPKVLLYLYLSLISYAAKIYVQDYF